MAKSKTVKFFIANSFFEKEEVEGIIKTFDECPNEQWGFRKFSNRLWNVTHIRSGLEAVQGTSQKDCERQLKDMLASKKIVEHIQNIPNIDETIAQRKDEVEKKALKNKKFQKLREEFKQITGITCPIDPILGGVDIVRLDRMIRTPDNISMSTHLKNTYGDRANAIVDEMINNL